MQELAGKQFLHLLVVGSQGRAAEVHSLSLRLAVFPNSAGRVGLLEQEGPAEDPPVHLGHFAVLLA